VHAKHAVRNRNPENILRCAVTVCRHSRIERQAPFTFTRIGETRALYARMEQAGGIHRRACPAARGAYSTRTSQIVR
jgi:hypothetical protein